MSEIPQIIEESSGHKWRWVVLFGAFLSFFIADGWSYSFPMLFPNLVEEFQESRGVTSYVPTLLYATPMLLSHLACSAIPKIGCKKLGIFGGVMICISLVLASFSTSLWALLLSVGILTSVALVAMYISAYVAVTYWFDDATRGLATGIAVAGSGLGSVLFPHFMEWLMWIFGWRGMVLIMAGVCLNATISGFLYRPFPVPLSTQTKCPGKNTIQDISTHELLTKSTENPSSVDNILYATPSTEQVQLDCKSILKTSIPEISLLKEHKLFALFCFANFILYLWVSIPYLYIYDWAVEVIKLPPDQATWILSAVGVARTVGQIVIGVFVDRQRVSPNLVLAVSVLFCAISVFLIPFTSSFSFLLILIIIFGFTVSSTYVLPMLCMGELIGLDKAVPGLGMLQFVQGIATLAGSPIGGWIYDFWGSYDWAFYLSGALMSFAAFLLAFLPFLVKKINTKGDDNGDNVNSNVNSDINYKKESHVQTEGPIDDINTNNSNTLV